MRLANTFCATKRIRRSNMFCATKAIRRANRFCAMRKFSSRKQMSDETFLIALIFLRRTDVSATSFAGRIFFCRANISAPNNIRRANFMRRTVVSSPYLWCNEGLHVAHCCATKWFSWSRKGFLHDLCATDYARRIFCRGEVSATK